MTLERLESSARAKGGAGKGGSPSVLQTGRFRPALPDHERLARPERKERRP